MYCPHDLNLFKNVIGSSFANDLPIHRFHENWASSFSPFLLINEQIKKENIPSLAEKIKKRLCFPVWESLEQQLNHE